LAAEQGAQAGSSLSRVHLVTAEKVNWINTMKCKSTLQQLVGVGRLGRAENVFKYDGQLLCAPC
jgi:hypothetical protein